MNDKVKLINAIPIIEFIQDGLNRTNNPFGYDAIEILGEIEFADEVLVATQATWEHVDPTTIKCSKCSYYARSYNNTPFCCNCGAKMKRAVEKESNA